MNNADTQYLNAMRDLLNKGVRREGRNGHVTYGLFGTQLRFNLAEGFPLLTTKKVFFKGIVAELLWFLKGDTNIEYLHKYNVHIWDEWADKDGNLGPVYGAQWRSWIAPLSTVDSSGLMFKIDQITDVINGLKKDPHSRRHMVSAWNPAETKKMALPPCHAMFQFHVADGKLNCQLYQRSADWFLGVPFNIASYALLTILMAREVNLVPGEFIHTFGDYHLYENHREQAMEQLLREPRKLPVVDIHNSRGIFQQEVEDIRLLDYDPWPAIKGEVAV